MAYVFNGVNQLLGNEQEKQNIFGQQQGADQTAQQQQQPEQSNGGDYIAPAQSSGSQQQVNAPKAQQKAVIQRNVGEQAAPTAFTNKIGQQLQQTQQGLQNEANAYTSGISNKTEKDYGYDFGQINDAIGGNTEAIGKLATRLSGQAPETPQYEQKAPTEVKDVSLLGSHAGLGQALARNQNERYTTGEQNLDSILLGKNPTFQGQRQDLINQQALLNEQAKTYRDTLPGQGEEMTKAGYEGATKHIKSDLTDAQKALIAKQEREAAEESARRAGLAGNHSGYVNDAVSNAITGIKPNWNVKYGFTPEEISRFVNPEEFYSPGLTNITPQQMISGEESMQYNNILSLLGVGGQQWGESLPVTGEGFDTQGYQSALSNYANKRVSEQDAVEAAARDLAAKNNIQNAGQEFLDSKPIGTPGQLAIDTTLPPGYDVGLSGNAFALPTFSNEREIKFPNLYDQLALGGY